MSNTAAAAQVSISLAMLSCKEHDSAHRLHMMGWTAIAGQQLGFCAVCTLYNCAGAFFGCCTEHTSNVLRRAYAQLLCMCGVFLWLCKWPVCLHMLILVVCVSERYSGPESLCHTVLYRTVLHPTVLYCTHPYCTAHAVAMLPASLAWFRRMAQQLPDCAISLAIMCSAAELTCCACSKSWSGYWLVVYHEAEFRFQLHR